MVIHTSKSPSTPILWEPARRYRPQRLSMTRVGHASTRNAHFSSCFLPTSLSAYTMNLSSGVELEAHEFAAPELVLLVHVTQSLRI